MQLIQIIDHSLHNMHGLLFVAIGLAISLRFVGFPDLTVEGSFTAGAVVFAVLSRQQISAFICLAGAAGAGLAAGVCTAILNQYLNLGKIISSIIVMLSFLLMAPYIAGGATVGLLGVETAFTGLDDLDSSLGSFLFGNASSMLHLARNSILLVIELGTTLVLIQFFTRRLGQEMRYVGSAKESGLVPKSRRKLLTVGGLALGNLLVGLGGAIEADKNGGFTQNMGSGILLVGLAIIVLGESLVKAFKKRDFLTVKESFLALLAGCFIYSLGIQGMLYANLYLVDIRLATTVFLLLCLIYASKYHPNSASLF